MRLFKRPEPVPASVQPMGTPVTMPIRASEIRGFRTASGTLYDLNDAHTAVRRIDLYGNPQMRHDGEWIDLYEKPDIQVGRPVVLLLEPLSSHATATVRTTTTVEEIFW